MSRGTEPLRCDGRRDGDGTPPSGRVHRFLRLGHLLGSALQEIRDHGLETSPDRPPLTRARFCLLKLITLNAGLQVGEVARRLGVSPAATSKHLDLLEASGLVVRRRVPGDRRAIAIMVSGDGRRLVRDYEQRKRTLVAPVLDELSELEHDQLCRLLERVCLDLLLAAGADGDEAGVCLRCAGYFHPDCAIGGRFGRCGFRSSDAGGEDDPIGGVS